MEWHVTNEPAYTLLKIFLEEGESIVAETGAFIYGRGSYKIETSTGGILSGLARAVLGGETLFLNRFRSTGQAEIWLAPPLPGDIKYYRLEKPLIIQDMSFLAYHGNVRLTIAWKGLKGLLAEGELFWLKAEGEGGVWINGYGGIEEVTLEEGEKATIDNFHFIAMEDGMKWSVKKFGGWKSFILGGEGIIFTVEGPGKLYIQSRSLPPLIQWIRKFISK